MDPFPNHSITQSLNHSIRVVGVVGAGQMGHGIAHVMLRAGLSVLLMDASAKFLEGGAARIAKGLARDVEKERLPEEARKQALGRLKTTTDIAVLSGAEFVIEAVTENFEVKAAVWRALDQSAVRKSFLPATLHRFP